MTERIRQIHVMSDCTYGRARVQAELRDMERCGNHKRIERLMSSQTAWCEQAQGLCGDHAQKPASQGGARSGEASIHGHGYQSVVGGRYDLCAQLGKRESRLTKEFLNACCCFKEFFNVRGLHQGGGGLLEELDLFGYSL